MIRMTRMGCFLPLGRADELQSIRSTEITKSVGSISLSLVLTSARNARKNSTWGKRFRLPFAHMPLHDVELC